MATDEDIYHELSYYTLAHQDPSFIHQHIVDAYAAQHANETSKPISVVFALVGLYLYVEKQFTGRQVQKAHVHLAKRRRSWHPPPLPKKRGAIVVSDVLASEPGQRRDDKIHDWCVSVWEAWKENHDQIKDLAKNELGIS